MSKSPGGKGDKPRPVDRDKYEEGYKQAYGDHPCPIESRDLSWLDEKGTTNEQPNPRHVDE